MAKVARVKPTLADAVDVKAVWEMVPNFTMGDVSLNEFTAIHDAADGLDKGVREERRRTDEREGEP